MGLPSSTVAPSSATLMKMHTVADTYNFDTLRYIVHNMVPVSARTPPRVLVVDDEESVRLFAERALRDAGYSVHLASDGSEALKLAEEHGPFALFILDVVMPQMTGEEVSRRLRLLNPDVKVLYFTGYSDRLFEERNVLWANESFLEKPVSVQALLEAVSFSLFGDTQGLRN
jgi:two-component system cell cycle sensor histidine kinase/response regulator CckA